MSNGNLIGLRLYGRSLNGVLLARHIDAGLYFAQRYGAEVKIAVGHAFEPRNHGPVWTYLA